MPLDHTHCAFCAAPPFAVYDLRAAIGVRPTDGMFIQRAVYAPLCYDHHAVIAAAAAGWPEPATGLRWELHGRRPGLLRPD